MTDHKADNPDPDAEVVQDESIFPDEDTFFDDDADDDGGVDYSDDASLASDDLDDDSDLEDEDAVDDSDIEDGAETTVRKVSVVAAITGPFLGMATALRERVAARKGTVSDAEVLQSDSVEGIEPEAEALTDDDPVVATDEDAASKPHKPTRAERREQKRLAKEAKKAESVAGRKSREVAQSRAAALRAAIEEQKKGLRDEGALTPLLLIALVSFLVCCIAGIYLVQPSLQDELESYDLDLPMVRIKSAQADLEALADMPDLPRLDKAWVEFGHLAKFCGFKLTVLNPKDVDGLYRGNVDAWHAAVVGKAARGSLCLAQYADKYPMIINQILVDDRGADGTFNATVSILGVLPNES